MLAGGSIVGAMTTLRQSKKSVKEGISGAINGPLTAAIDAASDLAAQKIEVAAHAAADRLLVLADRSALHLEELAAIRSRGLPKRRKKK